MVNLQTFLGEFVMFVNFESYPLSQAFFLYFIVFFSLTVFKERKKKKIRG